MNPLSKNQEEVKDCYGFEKVTEVDPENFKYKPMHFVMAHCEEGTVPDSQLQIWDVAFEPGRGRKVATCGGRFLCIFRPESGELLMRYSHPQDDNTFYSLSWSALARHYLATGSNLGEVRLFDHKRKVCFGCWMADDRRGVGWLHAVEFHNSAPGKLFVASNDSVVCLRDIGQPEAPDYGQLAKKQPVKLVQVSGCEAGSPELYSLAWLGPWLMAGTSEGLLGWSLPQEALERRRKPLKIAMVNFELISDEESKEFGESVDSVTSLGQGLVAAKCVNYGKILVFRADFPALQAKNRCGDLCKVEVLLEFAWRRTPEHYINITGDVSQGTMVCGDQLGAVWLYSLPKWLRGQQEEGGHHVMKQDREGGPSNLPMKLLPLGRLPWPPLDGEEMRTDILIDKVVLSPGAEFLVAVTNNNVVAFWRRWTEGS